MAISPRIFKRLPAAMAAKLAHVFVAVTTKAPIKHDYVMAVEYESFEGGYTAPSLITMTGPTKTSGPNGLAKCLQGSRKPPLRC